MTTTDSSAPPDVEAGTDGPRPQRSRSALAAVLGLAAVVVVLLVGWLLWPAAPAPTVLYTGTPAYAVTATIDSTRVGMTAVEVDVTGRTGTTAPPTMVEVDTVMPPMGHAGPSVLAGDLGGGRYRADGVMLMMTGPWELQLTISSATGVEHLMLPITVSG